MTKISKSKLSGSILVTGATGFVGSHLARKLVMLGCDIHVLVRPTSNLWRLKDISSKITLHHGDLADKASVEKVVAEVKPKGIFHLGAAIVISGLGADSETMVAANVLGTVNLLDAASSYPYDFFVAMGSFLEYGFKDHPIAESEICQPGELYGITKLLGTLYGQALARREGKPIVTLRLFTPYGPWNEKERLTHKIIASALAGKEIALTRPTVSRDFVFIDDIVELILEAALAALKYRGEIFNLGSGVRTPIGDVVSYILKKTNSKSEVKWGTFRGVSYDSDWWQADMTKTFSCFSWRPKCPLHAGLDKTIEHFKKYAC
ncbi:MAG: NAD-dependent epimerase/dehydratase family protein [Candidatus Taylorbacteria bacterium]|nr:NAD-dependent epimerase/dehydratase family protein [Candidatus Taylorbacteria bacterium]